MIPWPPFALPKLWAIGLAVICLMASIGGAYIKGRVDGSSLSAVNQLKAQVATANLQIELHQRAAERARDIIANQGKLIAEANRTADEMRDRLDDLEDQMQASGAADRVCLDLDDARGLRDIFAPGGFRAKAASDGSR